MIKALFTSLLPVLLIYCQSKTDKKLFHPDSDYLHYGSYKVNFYSAKPDTQSSQNRNRIGYYNYKPIPYRTVAVNPREILIGSVLFIPQAVGTPLPDGSYHDGYFIAHDILTVNDKKTIAFFTEYDQNGNNSFTGSNKILPLSDIDIYLVHGVMEKVINLQYKYQYQPEKIKQTYQMTWNDLEKLMQEAKVKFKIISERVEYLSERGKGTPYVMFHLGEGPGNKIDPDPLIDTGRTDCMTFCEYILALAISDNYNQMFNNLQKIRYKDGKIDFTSRNHYTIADWLPNNSWLLYDATKEIGGNLCKPASKTINRKELFLNAGLLETEIKDIIPVQKLTVKYISAVDLLKIENNLKGGEIASIITKKSGIFSAHMGIIVRDQWDNMIFRHASSLERNMQVIDQRFDEIVDSIRQSKTRIGMIFMRVREDIF